MKSVYPFTNENVASFNQLYNFSNAKVLSVLGSGDQYFSSLLYGAQQVELYDINSITWDYFLLKYYGIMIFSYEEFYDYFVNKKMDDPKYFKRLIKYLPVDVANRLSDMYQKNNGLSKLLFLDIANHDYNDGQVIPYFNKENYHQLQSILSKQAIPIFYSTSLAKLANLVSNKSYDIILTSNIFDWMFTYQDIEDVKVYKEILNSFHYSEIQALYKWNKLDDDFKIELERNGFDIEEVPCARKLSLSAKDTVVSLRKK